MSGTVELFTEARYVGFDKNAADLAGVSQEMANLLGGEDPRLRVWHFGGSLSHIDQDIVLPGGTCSIGYPTEVARLWTRTTLGRAADGESPRSQMVQWIRQGKVRPILGTRD